MSDLLAAAPGAFLWATEQNDGGFYRVVWFKLPDGTVGRCPIRPSLPGAPGWQHVPFLKDGPLSDDKPTIVPSVRMSVGRQGDVELWHGWIKNGRMESV